MQQFMLETALLLVAAFVFGAALGCFIRSLFLGSAPKATQTAAAAATATAAAALAGEEEDEGGPVISTAHGYVGLAKYIDEFPFPKKSVEDTQRSAVPAAVAAMAASMAAKAVETQKDKVATAPSSAPTSPPAEDDDLTLLRGVTPAIQGKIQSLGFTKFEQIANWTLADVVSVNSAIGAASLVQTENFVEQAKILASGGTTHFAAARAKGDTKDDDPDGSGSGSSGPSMGGGASGGGAEAGGASFAASVASASSHLSGEGLTLREELREGALPYTFAQMNLFASSQRPGRRRRVSSSNSPFLLIEHEMDWDDPAQFSRPVKRARPKRSVSVKSAKDDLKKIKSIGLLVEKDLNALGIATFEQIAKMSPNDLSTMCSKLNSMRGQIDPTEWNRQAKQLVEGKAISTYH